MRTFVLIVFEIAVLFGIPRMINELRGALGEARPAVATVSPAKESRPASVAPAKAVLAAEAGRAQLLQVPLQASARTVAKLQPLPQALVPSTQIPAKAAVPARDDDYLPPWMRGAAAANRDAAPAASIPAPAAAKKSAATKQAGQKRRRSDRGRYAYASNSRHTNGPFLFGF
jgi:hypothetical protein